MDIVIPESEFPYAMAVRDALVALPDKVLRIADRERWPNDPKAQAELGATARRHRQSKPVVEQLHPTLEDALFEPMNKEPAVHHYFDVASKEGMLVARTVETAGLAKAQIGEFMRGQGGWEQAMRCMGLLSHRLIDLWNPFNLSTEPQIEPLRQRFMEDFRINVLDMPFFWKMPDTATKEVFAVSPYMDQLTAIIEAERIRDKYLKAFADCYVLGNGYPAARQLFYDWYDTLVNVIGRAWLFCCA